MTEETIRHLVLAEQSLGACRTHLCAAFQSLPDDDVLGAEIKARWLFLFTDDPATREHGNGTYFHVVALAIQSVSETWLRRLKDADECIGDIYCGGENISERVAKYYRQYENELDPNDPPTPDPGISRRTMESETEEPSNQPQPEGDDDAD